MLTDKQRVFVEEYLTCWSATEAAKRAGYSERTAYSIGQENLKKPEVAEYIKERLADKCMTADEVLARLALQARTTVEDFGNITEMGTFQMDLNKAKKAGKLGSVKKIKPTKTGYDLELHDQQAALVHIGKAHGIFIDKTENSGEITHTVKVIRNVSMDDL